MSTTDGDILKGVLELELEDGTIAQNVFYFQASFQTTQSDSAVAAAIESYIEDIYDAVVSFLSDGFTINPSYVHEVAYNSETSQWETVRLLDVINPSFTHTNTDDPFPNQIAPVLVANTTRPSSFGRKFLMGFVETAALGGDLTTSALTALATALASYIADETISAGNDLIVGVPRSHNSTFLTFTDGVVNSIVGTQRRRKPGVGA